MSKIYSSNGETVHYKIQQKSSHIQINTGKKICGNNIKAYEEINHDPTYLIGPKGSNKAVLLRKHT